MALTLLFLFWMSSPSLALSDDNIYEDSPAVHYFLQEGTIENFRSLAKGEQYYILGLALGGSDQLARRKAALRDNYFSKVNVADKKFSWKQLFNR